MADNDCECIEKCTFFTDMMSDKQPIALLMQNRLCRREWAECARHQVFTALGGGNVPRDLYPVDVDRAARIIESGVTA